jgi:hypothetical protein
MSTDSHGEVVFPTPTFCATVSAMVFGGLSSVSGTGNVTDRTAASMDLARSARCRSLLFVALSTAETICSGVKGFAM